MYDTGKIPIKKIKDVLMNEHNWTEKEFKKYYDLANADGFILHTDGQHVKLA
jgi:hypothetical protein